MTIRNLGGLIAGFGLAAMAIPVSAATPSPILDYRKPMADRPPAVSAQTRAALAKAMAAIGPTRDVVVLGHVRGSFSAASGTDDLYLVADRTPVAAEPFPEGPGQLLVAIRDGRTFVYKLPSDMRYQRIAGMVDADRDGRGEVMLETAFYNMGQSVTSLDLVALGPDGATAIRQSLKEVVSDSCDNPSGKREKRASTIALGEDGKLVATSHSQRCR